MSEETMSRVFEPFFTTKEVGRGTGQGLAIARTIVTQDHPRLRFNYRTKFTEVWEPHGVGGFAWEAEFPPVGSKGLTVKLD